MKSQFKQLYSLLITIFGMAYIFAMTFCHIPAGNERYADTILGFVLGTLFATAVNWALGSSKGSSDKTEIMAAEREDV